jgi:hypothetical protein
MRLELNRVEAAIEPWDYGPFAQQFVGLRRRDATLSFTTTNPTCPQCGGDLRRSRLVPHGEDADGVVYMARLCRAQGLMFGRAVDGSWTIPVSGINFN